MTISEFLHMGGYGLYVWSSFGAAALLMTVEPILVKHRRRVILQRIARIVRMKTEEQR